MELMRGQLETWALRQNTWATEFKSRGERRWIALGIMRNPRLTHFSSSMSLFPPLSTDPPPVSLVPNEQQLARLTDYVAFLEN